MKRIIKTVFGVIALTAAILLMSSCKLSKNDKDIAVVDDSIFSPNIDSVLVLGEGASDEQAKRIKDTYYSLLQKELKVAASESEKTEHKIILGKNDSEISQKAYRALELLEKESESDVGFVIYAKSSSVAIAFDPNSFGVDVALEEAVSAFIEHFMRTDTLKLDDGVVYKSTFDPFSWQEQRDKENVEALWNVRKSQLTNILNNNDAAEEIIEGLKNLYTIYDQNQRRGAWLANLYDPVTGGFYYSNSARNNIGYAPDLESTAQAIGIVESVLIGYQGTLGDYFGEEISGKFVRFVKDMQNSQNGYFYHPQWKRELVDANPERRSRDLLNAISVLDNFGAKPTYDTPNGIKGDGIQSIGNVVSTVHLTSPLVESKPSIVSVSSISNDDLYIPAYLTSKENFEEYISSLNLKNDISSAAEELLSKTSIILKRDLMLEEQGAQYRFADICSNALLKYQKNSGLWVSKNDITFKAINEFSSIVKIFSGLGKVLPSYDEAFESIADYMQSHTEEDISEITSISDCFATLSLLKDNVNRHGTENDKRYLHWWISEILTDLIDITRQSLFAFAIDDGSFALSANGNSGEAFGMPIAVTSIVEGNVYATLLATKNLWLSIFNVIGIGNIPVYGKYDRMIFQSTLFDMGVIIKNEIPKAEPIDFEAEDVGDSAEAIISSTIKSGGSVTVADGPKEYGKVLNIVSHTNGEDKHTFKLASRSDNASCNVFELDMCVLPDTENGAFLQLWFAPEIYMIRLSKDGDFIRFHDVSSLSAPHAFIHYLGKDVKVGEWFNLRVEYYVGAADTVRIKVFLNGECIVVGDNYYGSYKLENNIEPASNYTGFLINPTSGYRSNILIDNVIAEQNYMTYAPESNGSGTILRNVDAPSGKQKVHNFESTDQGKLPDGFTVNGNSSLSSVVTDLDGNKCLSVGSGGGTLALPMIQRGSDQNSALLYFDVAIDESSEAGAKYDLSFNEFSYKERSFASIQLLIIEDGGRKYVTFAESSSKITGDVFSNVKIPLEEKFTLSLQIFFKQGVLLIGVNGETVAVSDNVLKEIQRRYLGGVTITNVTSTVSSRILIDNLVCERAYADFDKVTKPSLDRTTHTFESLEGIESAGNIYIVSEALSFDNATYGSYIRIPVNSRSSINTYGYLSFSVTNLYIKSDGVIVSLDDNKLGKIAAFLLLASNEGVSIYEYTENGRYSTPIASVSDSSFNFGIEYSSLLESCNILINGNYVASTSVSYVFEGLASNFDTVTLEALGKSGLQIDNLIAETTGSLFTKPKYAIANRDDSLEVMTYETSSFAMLPKRISLSLGSVASVLRVRESVIRGQASRVLEINSGLDASQNDYITFFKTKSASSFNAVAFETDMMLNPTTNEMTLEIEPQSDAKKAYFISIKAYKNGNKMLLKGTGSDFSEELDIRAGEWFKFRMEYTKTNYDFNYDGVADVLVRVYINGNLVARGFTPYYKDAIVDAAVVSRIRACVNAKFSGKVYLDNTVFEQFKMSYDAPLPPDTDVLTYEPGVITSKLQSVMGSSTGTVKIVDMTVDDAVTKVLRFVTAAGGVDRLKISPTVNLVGANGLSFETDLMIKSDTLPAVFYLEPITSGENPAVRLILTAKADGAVTLSTREHSEIKIGEVGKWIHLKLTYMNPRIDYNGDNLRDLLYKVYIGDSDTPILTGYMPCSSGEYYNPSQITHVRLYAPNTTVGEFYLDNTMNWQMIMTADEAPPREEDSLPPGHENDDSLTDSDGWTK